MPLLSTLHHSNFALDMWITERCRYHVSNRYVGYWYSRWWWLGGRGWGARVRYKLGNVTHQLTPPWLGISFSCVSRNRWRQISQQLELHPRRRHFTAGRMHGTQHHQWRGIWGFWGEWVSLVKKKIKFILVPVRIVLGTDTGTLLTSVIRGEPGLI